DASVGQYLDKAQGLSPRFLPFATGLFKALFLLEVMITIASHAFQRSEPLEIALDLLKRAGIAALMYLLLTNYSSLVGSFLEWFQLAGGPASIDADGIISRGQNLVTAMYDKLGQRGAGALLKADTWLVIIAAVVIMIAFAFLACLMILALLEAWFVAAAALLLGGLSGWGATREIALHAYRAPLASMMKLLAVEVLVQIGESQILAYTDMVASAQDGELSKLAIFILSGVIIYVGLVIAIPPAMARVVGGAFAPNPIAAVARLAATAAVGAAGRTAAGAAGGIWATTQAGARTIERQRDNGQRPTFFGTLGGTGAELARAGLADVGARLSGRARAGVGTTGGRMAENIREARRKDAVERAEPKAPSTPPTTEPTPPVVRGPKD
ncbi:MAG: type IV secretion system protein, partial [Dehalococcoidia bacterium]|nr:type IV secretion system protein [Dehalococcoidia bacterium]